MADGRLADDPSMIDPQREWVNDKDEHYEMRNMQPRWRVLFYCNTQREGQNKDLRELPEVGS